MNIPQMPSITDLPIQELRNADVAFKVLEENLGEIHNPKGDGNCGYYAIFEAFAFLGKTKLARNSLPICNNILLQEQKE